MPTSFGDFSAVGWVDRIGKYLPEGHLVTFGQVYDVDRSKMSEMIFVNSDHVGLCVLIMLVFRQMYF
jgi:hypothetical protein